ncbi:hypothetical protein PUN28_005968 [Cardiocondyla obscurior]|uniref:Transmembrane protein n=1 Tax=Cardiocondyla obscurior TaxID=286306 RepID=A0AAW2GBY8_9HYME
MKRFIVCVKYLCNTVIAFRFARVVCIASSNASFALDFSLITDGKEYRGSTRRDNDTRPIPPQRVCVVNACIALRVSRIFCEFSVRERLAFSPDRCISLRFIYYLFFFFLAFSFSLFSYFFFSFGGEHLAGSVGTGCASTSSGFYFFFLIRRRGHEPQKFRIRPDAAGTERSINFFFFFFFFRWFGGLLS